MKALYNEYLTGSERELAIIFAESDAEIAKLNVLYETVQAKREADMLAAEAKVLCESGTYDDLTMLYMEADAEANEKETGILKKLWNIITGIFAKIKKFFVGEKDIPDEIEVTKETESHFNFITKITSIIDAGIGKFRSGDYGGAAVEFGKIVLPTVGAAAVTGVAIWKKDKISEAMKKCTKISNDLESALNTAHGKIDDSTLPKLAKDGLHKGLNLISPIIGFVSNTISKIKEGINAAKNVVKNIVKPKTGEEIPEIKPINRNIPQYKNLDSNTYLTDEEKNKAIEDVKTKLGRDLKDEEKTNVLDNAAVKKFNAEKEKKNKENLQKIKEDEEKAKADREAGYGESASINNVDKELSDIFYESELVDEEYAELVEAFAEL